MYRVIKGYVDKETGETHIPGDMLKDLSPERVKVLLGDNHLKAAFIEEVKPRSTKRKK